MTTYIEMFNADLYSSWDMAENQGAVYTVAIHSVNVVNNRAGKIVMDDVLNAITETAFILVDKPNIKSRYRNEL